MVYFLERIAKHLYESTGGDIGRHCLVFPSRRAGLYFMKYYSALLEKPAWAPVTLTSNEFFGSFSDLMVADTEVLLFELYRVYLSLNRRGESFDEFYFWGDMLLNDFDDVDKYMADARVVFRNVEDFRNIDAKFGDLDPEQAEIIKQFWRNFEPEKQSPQKDGFITVWSILEELYSGFRKALRSSGLAYEGMIMRDVAESFGSGKMHDLKWEKVHFIGFNALNKCELTLMKQLQDQGKACFYWDYDTSYIGDGNTNSAGLFMNRNLKVFRNDMPADWQYGTLLSLPGSDVTRRVIGTASDNVQVKLIPELLGSLPALPPEEAHHTAVILVDENLIVPLLTSLPGGIGDINITMGYPLKMTGVYSLVKHILNLQRNASAEGNEILFSRREVIDILRHPLVADVSGNEERSISAEIQSGNLFRIPAGFLCKTRLMEAIFKKSDTPLEFSDYLINILEMVSAGGSGDDLEDPDSLMQRKLRNEFLHTVLKTIRRLEPVADSQDVTFRIDTYIRILDKILRNQSVPFTGEPLSGIQIMGFLETRALDFRNIIMLSVNEGTLPSVSTGSSFIPYSIREAFGLPVINHQESLYAYHFFRLLHRAENVTFVYNSDSSGMRTGEMSRFLTQMKYARLISPETVTLNFDIRTGSPENSEIEKTDMHRERLLKLYSGEQARSMLSPTAINTWLNCRMRFYYRYVSGLKEPDQISPEIDHAVFGQVLHRIMKEIYTVAPGKDITADYIDSLSGNTAFLNGLIDQTVDSIYGQDHRRPESGNDIIIKDILLVYLRRILAADRYISPFAMVGTEEEHRFNLPVRSDGKELRIRTGGSIDRIDRVGGRLRIVDYKTGEVAAKIPSLDDLFTDDRKKEFDGWLQTLLYCEAWLSNNPAEAVRPSIYRVKELKQAKADDALKIKEDKNSEWILEDYRTVRETFMAGITGVVASIFSSGEPFRMTKSLAKCNYCPYRGLCRR
ncbi:MAG: PD-(D/E)XK nuclease family protein [Bacteroidales bacterium]